MRIERALVGLLFIATATAGGCGRLAYNLPPAQRIMEPGPGVGGPGPGVIPPAGSPYGIYGGAVDRLGGGMGAGRGGGAMGPGAPCGPCGANGQPPMGQGGVMQAGFECPCEGQC